MPLESSIVASILRKLNSLPGTRAKKHHGSQFGSIELDIYGVSNGVPFFIEAKQPGKKPTARQEREIAAWRAAGAKAGVATSVNEALEILQN